MPECIYNPITTMGFSAMFTFQLDTLRGKNCRHPIAVMGVVDMFGSQIIVHTNPQQCKMAKPQFKQTSEVIIFFENVVRQNLD